MMRGVLATAVAMALVACGHSGSNVPADGDARSDGAPGGAVPLTFPSNYDLQGFVDTTGPYSNLYTDRFDVYGGSPTPAGYTWSIALGPGVPDTVTVDSATGVFGGTLASNFTPGPPGTTAPPYTYYDVTVTVSDGTSSVSSPAGGVRLRIRDCNSNLNGSLDCSGEPNYGFGRTPPHPQGPPILAAFAMGATQQNPYEQSCTNGIGLHVGQPMGCSLSIQGGTAPYTFQVVAGSLPPGLSLQASSGVISGTPAATAVGNAYPFTVTVTDQAGNQSTAYYTMDSFLN